MKVQRFDTINVVPFIDIMLVLLVIVLTTATFVAKGIIPVDLPDSKSAIKLEDIPKTITISVKSDGEILLDDTVIVFEDLKTQIVSLKKDTNIQINCDKNAKFDQFMQILDTLKINQFENIGIITKKEK